MDKKDIVRLLLSKKNTRLALCERSLKYFAIHYFSEFIKYPEFAPYHNQWFSDVESGFNLYVEAHRDAAKTTLIGIVTEIWKICFNKAQFYCNVCYDKRKAKALNKIIANILLTNKKIKDDF